MQHAVYLIVVVAVDFCSCFVVAATAVAVVIVLVTTTTMSYILFPQPSSGYRFGSCQPDIGGHYDPFNRPPPSDPSYFCTPDRENITNCEVGDLTGKHDTIDVTGSPLPYQQAAFFFTDIFLNLTGENAIEGRSIAIHAPNRTAPIIACAPLVRNEIRFATQFPSPSFEASQPSPYDLTTITLVNLSSPNIAILPDVLTTYDLCPANSAPYSPFTANSQLSTPDGLPIGALYQKYATQLRAMQSFNTTELYVYGVYTVTSRTLRILGSNRRTCSAITPPYNINTTVAAIATFNDSTLNGAVIFVSNYFH